MPTLTGVRLYSPKDTDANWKKNNPTLSAGELVIVTDSKYKFKIASSNAKYNDITFPVAEKATKLETARKIGSASFDGTADITLSQIGAAPASHSHSNILIKLNGGTTEGTNLFTYNGGTSKTINITPSSIGASASGHTHDDRYYTESEIDTTLSAKVNQSTITTATDFNSLNTTGIYHIATSVSSSLHAPTTNHGTLIVDFVVGTPYQIWIPDNANTQYKRTYIKSSSTWNSWTEQKLTDTVYTHPTHTAYTSGLYKITTNSLGHVTSASAVTKSDITSLGIPASDTNTWRGIQNNLTSESTSDSLSAAQGKLLNELTYQRREEVGNSTNWNTLLSPGCYKVQITAWGDVTKLFSPNEYNSNIYSYGLLFVITAYTSDSEKRTTQIYIPHKADANVNSVVLTRMHNSSDTNAGWQSWHPLARGLNWSDVIGKPSSYTPSSHTHTKSQITDFPSSMPASDVYAWAKASTKPSYTWSEIGGKPTTYTASRAMILSAGKISGLLDGSSTLYGNGLAISNPATANDVGFIRVTGTGESDTTLEIATGDDGGSGEQIVVRQYTTSNTVRRELKLLDYNGNTSIPYNLTVGGSINGYYFSTDQSRYRFSKSIKNNTTEIWYVKIILTRGWACTLDDFKISASYDNRQGIVYLHKDSYNDRWYLYRTDYNDSNILSIATSGGSNTTIWIKLRASRTSGGGQCAIDSNYTIETMEIVTDISDVTFLNLSPGLNSNTPISTSANFYGNLKGTADYVPWSGVTGKPTSLPASDVYAWAKSSTKPSYTWSEIEGKPSTFTPSSHTHTVSNITDFTNHVYDATISRTANTILAAPNSSNGVASFRKLVAADLPSHTHSYLPLSGGTLSGALTFANGTWNTVGDDVAIGDHNIAGSLGVKGLNGDTKITLIPHSGSTANTISNDGTGNLSISGTTNGTFKGNLTGNATSATNISSQAPILGAAVESNEISIKNNGNGTLFDSKFASIRSALDFRWYASHWQIGNIRGDSDNSIGFGFVFSSDNKTFTAVAYIDTSGVYHGKATSATSADGASDSDKLDGYHEQSFLRYRAVEGGNGGTSHANTLWSQIGIKQYNHCLPDGLGDNATYTYGSVISLPGQDSRFDLWYNHQTSATGDGLRYRTGWGTDKKPWATIIDSSNYTLYTVTKTGSGASGTWGISISGNAATASKASSADSVTWGNVSGKPSSFTPSSHTHSYLPLSGGSLSGNISFSNNTGITALMAGGSDGWGIVGSGTDDAGRLKIYVSDNGTSDWIDFEFRDYTGTTYTPLQMTGNRIIANCTIEGNISGSAGSVAWTNVSGRPSSLPASDVYSWAKASSKPAYNWSEIGSKPTTFTPSSHTHAYITSSGRLKAETTSNRATGLLLYEIYDNGYPFTYGNVIQFNGSNGVGQLAAQWHGSGLAYRSAPDTSTTYSDWVIILTSSNYTSYAAAKNHSHSYAAVSHTHTKSQITDFPSTMANPHSITIKLNGGSTEGSNLFTYNGSSAKSLNITASSIGAATSGHTHSGYASSNHTHSSITTIGDKRNDATTPNIYSNSFIFQGLKTNAKIGSPSTDTYSYLLGLRGWNDNSGGDSWELAFNNSGIYARHGSSTSWNGWSRILDSSNYSSYAATVNHGHSDKMGSVTANGYQGLARSDGNTTDWIRTTLNGIIPYQSGGFGGGHGSLGTSSWYFSAAYIDTVYGNLKGCVDGVAKTLASGGNLNYPMTFNWSGQGGQPTWLWGGENGKDMYVYNPSNFSVASLGMFHTNTYQGADDNTGNWANQKNSVHWYSSALMKKQPGTYMYVLNIAGAGQDVHQLGFCQPGGTIWHRGGNSNGWAYNDGEWDCLLDTRNFNSYYHITYDTGWLVLNDGIETRKIDGYGAILGRNTTCGIEFLTGSGWMSVASYSINGTALGTSNNRWTNIYISGNVNNSSDEYLKDIIPTGIDDRYEKFFMLLNPILYKWKNNDKRSKLRPHDRIHCGLGARETERHAIECGLDSISVAAICKDKLEKPTEDGRTDEYGIAYTELHGLEIHMIQKAHKKISELEEKNQKLENELQELKQLVQQLLNK